MATSMDAISMDASVRNVVPHRSVPPDRSVPPWRDHDAAGALLPDRCPASGAALGLAVRAGVVDDGGGSDRGDGAADCGSQGLPAARSAARAVRALSAGRRPALQARRVRPLRGLRMRVSMNFSAAVPVRVPTTGICMAIWIAISVAAATSPADAGFLYVPPSPPAETTAATGEESRRPVPRQRPMHTAADPASGGEHGVRGTQPKRTDGDRPSVPGSTPAGVGTLVRRRRATAEERLRRPLAGPCRRDAARGPGPMGRARRHRGSVPHRPPLPAARGAGSSRAHSTRRRWTCSLPSPTCRIRLSARRGRKAERSRSCTRQVGRAPPGDGPMKTAHAIAATLAVLLLPALPWHAAPAQEALAHDAAALAVLAEPGTGGPPVIAALRANGAEVTDLGERGGLTGHFVELAEGRRLRPLRHARRTCGRRPPLRA